MEHQDILKALQENDLSFSSLAKAAKCSYQLLASVSKRRATSKRAAKIIAAGVGKDVSTVFPDKPEYAESDAVEARVERAKQLLEEAGIEAA